MTKRTLTGKQRSIRFSDELAERIENMAEQEGRTFSAQVMWLLRGALAQRTFAQPQVLPSSQQHAA